MKHGASSRFNLCALGVVALMVVMVCGRSSFAGYPVATEDTMSSIAACAMSITQGLPVHSAQTQSLHDPCETNLDCESPLICSSSRCLKPDGASCDEDSECANFCAGTVCSAGSGPLQL
jgi:hypothetical protein